MYMYSLQFYRAKVVGGNPKQKYLRVLDGIDEQGESPRKGMFVVVRRTAEDWSVWEQ